MNDPHRDPAQLKDDLAAYALDALDDEEAARLRGHLEGCDACRDRVLWLMPAVDQLPAAVEQRTPPESLRESLMATVRAEAAPPPATAQAGRARAGWWEGLRGTLLRPATGFAVVILLVAGIAAGYLLRGDEGGSEFFPASGGATASATLERHGDSATLHVNQLPALSSDEVYEVWVQRGGVMEPRNTFILGRDGSADAAVPGPLEGADAVLVTAEPAPGTRRPTSEPLLQAPLQ